MSIVVRDSDNDTSVEPRKSVLHINKVKKDISFRHFNLNRVENKLEKNCGLFSKASSYKCERKETCKKISKLHSQIAV